MTTKCTPYAGRGDTLRELATAGATKAQPGLGQGFVPGFIAAAYLSFAAAFTLGAGIESPGIQKLVMGLIFPIGLIAPVIGGGGMWTGTAMNGPIAQSLKPDFSCLTPQ